MKKTFLLAMSGIFLCSCTVSLFPEHERLTRLYKKYRENVDYNKGVYFGFSIDKSKFKNPGWFLIPKEQQPNKALFRQISASETHTFYAEAAIYNLPKGIDSIEQLKQLQKESFISKSKRNDLISEDYKIVEYKGVQCIKYFVKGLDKKPVNSKESLIITLTGYLCFHPKMKNMAFDRYYSERGQQDEINKSLFEIDGKDFLDSVIIK